MTDKEIADKANKNIHKEYPLLEHPIQEWMVREILKAVKK